MTRDVNALGRNEDGVVVFEAGQGATLGELLDQGVLVANRAGVFSAAVKDVVEEERGKNES